MEPQSSIPYRTLQREAVRVICHSMRHRAMCCLFRPHRPSPLLMRIAQILFLGIVSLLQCFICVHAAAPPLLFDPFSTRTQAHAGHVEFLEDPSAQLSLADIQAYPHEHRFRLVQGREINFGVTDSAYWLRLSLKNTDREHSAVAILDIALPYLDLVDFYAPQKAVNTGDFRPFSSREMMDRNFVFRVLLPPGETVPVFIRVKSNGALHVPLQIETPELHGLHGEAEDLLLGISFGVIAAMFLYNFLLFLSLRDTTYLWYVAFVASFSLFLVAANGMGYRWLYPDSPSFTNRAHFLFLAISLVFAIQFARQFLDLKRLLPGIDAFFRWLVVGAILFALVAALSESRIAATVQFFAFAGLLVAMYAGVRVWQMGYRPARFFVWAFLPVLASGGLMVLRNVGAVEASGLSLHALQMGVSLEVILWAFALADRIHLLKAEKDAAQARTVELLRQSEKELEGRVVERTSALQSEVDARRETERRLREREAELTRLAHFDALTGALNRHRLPEIVGAMISRANRQGQHAGLILVDLDRFKQVNDTHGHEAGDAVLIDVAQRLLGGVRASDAVVRLGGDEFVVLAGDLPDAAALATLTENLRQRFSPPLKWRGMSLQLSGSFGSALYPQDGRELEALMLSADRAMYAAKQANAA